MAASSDSAVIADALREWRERRRLSQLDLALEAGTTQRHVSFIERGRSRPGRAMVVRLTEALGVPLRERNAMLLAAGYAPAYPETQLADAELDPVRAALLGILEGHSPCPAVLTDAQADVVAANGAFWALIADVPPALREAPISLPRLLLYPGGLAERIINLEEWGRHVLDGLRRKADRNQIAELAALVGELEQFVPAPRQPASPEHIGFAVPLRLRAGAAELTLLTTLTHFATAIDVTVSELTLEAFVPANRETAAYLPQLVAERS